MIHRFRELKNYIKEYNSTIDTLIDRLRNVADGKTTIILGTELYRTTMDVISNVKFKYMKVCGYKN